MRQVEYFPHQAEGIARAIDSLEREGGAYLAWEPGMGKTRAALDVAQALRVGRTLVVTNVPGLGVWPREAERWRPGLPVEVWRGQVTGQRWRQASLLVTNYQQLIGEEGRRRLDMLVRWGPELLVLDEAHRAKSPSSQTSRACWKLASVARYRLLLSGTPAHNPLDWWSQFRMIAPYHPIWSQRFSEYRAWIAVLGGPLGVWVTGFRPAAREQAVEAMMPYTHVATVDQLCLPEPLTTEVPVDLDEAERSAYRTMERELLLELPTGEQASAAVILTKLLRLHQIAAGHVTTEAGTVVRLGRSKLEACMEVLEERSRHKVVVAYQYRADRDVLAEALRAARRPWLVIDGSVPPDAREQAVRTFQQRDEPYVLLVQYRAGGTSISLTAARTMVLYTFGPSVIDYRQMLGRVYRPGQTSSVQYIVLLARDTVDELFFAGLQQGLETMALARFVCQQLRREASHAS